MTMSYVKMIAPAKVNLALAVGRKQPDGYHAVDTIMHCLALHDTLVLRRSSLEGSGTGLMIRLTCDGPEVIEDLAMEDNIVYRAIKLFAQEIGRGEDEQIDIMLTKEIPSEAGLGGGSSDAAAALIGAAHLWDIAFDDPRLFTVARKLGADVSFFFYGGCAYLDDRGDHYVHSLIPTKGFVVLVRPDRGVSTKDAYAVFDNNPTYPSQAELDLLKTVKDATEVAVYNNLAQASEQLLPELTDIRLSLEEAPGVTQVVLCGSGSTTCAFCESYDLAGEVSMKMRKEGWKARVTSLASLGVSALETR